MTDMTLRGITGAGGGGKGGGSAGGGAAEDPNNLQSNTIARLLDAIADGEIGGLVDGPKSIFLNGTPLQASDNSYNFDGVSWQCRNGTYWQQPVSGFTDVEHEVTLNNRKVTVAVTPGPLVTTIESSVVDRLRVTMAVDALTDQDITNGNLHGASVQYAIDTRPEGGGWSEVVNDTISGKTTSAFTKSVSVPKPSGVSGRWDFRVRRITEDSTRVSLRNDLFVVAYTEITDSWLAYPDTALVAVEINAKQFGSTIPTRTYEIYGRKIRVPANYDPVARTYAINGTGTSGGIWDGTFKLAVSDNPAWVLYDLLTDDRAGLGAVFGDIEPNTASLYTIGRYCDVSIPDGFGGHEPRFRCNCNINTREEAYRVLQSIASIFRGMLYWSSGAVYVAADMPADPVKLVTPGNIVDGLVTYEGTGLKARHSVVAVTWYDPADSYKPAVELIEDAELIALYGWRQLDVTAYGCTSRGQAHRQGLWIINSERYETETATWTAAFDHADVTPGDIVEIRDPERAGVRFGGRLAGVSNHQQVTLDSPVDLAAGHSYALSIVMPDGTVATRPVVEPAGTHLVLTLDTPLPHAPETGAVWALIGTDVSPSLWRVMANVQTDKHLYRITALKHDSTKYDRIELGLKIDPLAYTRLHLGAAVGAPQNFTVTKQTYSVLGGLRARFLLSWSPPGDATVSAYQLQYEIPSGLWIDAGKLSAVSYEINDLEIGAYRFRVRSLTKDGRTSSWVMASSNVAIGDEAFADPPQTPTQLTLNTAVYEDERTGQFLTMIGAQWVPGFDSDIKCFEVAHKKTVDLEWQIDRTTDTVRTWWVDPGEEYRVKVRAVDLLDQPSAYTDDAVIVSAIPLARPSAPAVLSATLNALHLGQDTSRYKADVVLASNPVEERVVSYIIMIGSPSPEGGMEFTTTSTTLTRDWVGSRAGNLTHVRAKAVNVKGQASFWSTWTPLAMLTDTVPPADPANLAASAGLRLVNFSWVNPADEDFAGVEVYVSSTTARPETPTLTTMLSEHTITGLNRAEKRYVWLRSVDWSGNKGNFVGPVLATVGSIAQGDFDPGAPNTPTGLTLAQNTVVLDDGAVSSRLNITWTANAETDLNFYELEVREGRTASWPGSASSATGIPVSNATAYALAVRPGYTYGVRLRAVDFAGFRSGLTAESTLAIAGDTQAPGLATALTATAAFESVFLHWTNPADADLDHVEVWSSTINDSATAVKIGEVAGSAFTHTGLTAGQTRFYWLKTVDASDNASGFSAVATVTTAFIDLTGFPANLKPIKEVAVLPMGAPADGAAYVRLASNGRLYRWTGTAWVDAVSAGEMVGQISHTQIADVTAAQITGQVVAAQIADAAITTAKFAAGITPVEILGALPTTGNFQGRQVFLTTDSKTYRYYGAGWSSSIAAADVTGTLSAAQIASLAASQITGQLSDSQIASVAAAKVAGTLVAAQIADGAINTAKFAAGIEPVSVVDALPNPAGYTGPKNVTLKTDGKLYRYVNGAWVTGVASTDVTGQFVASQIADAAITTAKFASNIQPVAIVSSLPNPAGYGGPAVLYNTSDAKTYRWTGTGWTASVAAVDIAGQLSAAQVASLAASQITGQLTNSQIADVAAAKVTGTLTASQIASVAASAVVGTLSNEQIAALSAAKVTGQIAGTQIADNAISTPKLQAGAVVTANLAAGAVTATKLTIGNPDNIVPDADCRDAAFWFGTNPAAGDIIANAENSGSWWRSRGYLSLSGTGTRNYVTPLFPIRYAQYRARFSVYMSPDFVGSVAVLLHQPEVAWNTLGAASLGGHPSDTAIPYQFSNASTTKGTLLRFETTITNPETATNRTNHTQYRILISSTAGEFEIGDIELVQVSGATLIEDGAVTTDKVAANAIVAGKIAVNAVTAGAIAADAVTAAKIVAGAVVAGKIAADAVTAGTIAADAITAREIRAGAISTSQLAAGAVTAGTIAADAVTANAIAANAVTASELAVDAVTAGKIAAAAINAREIAAGAVTASKILVQSANLNPDPCFSDEAFWPRDADGWLFETNNGANGTGALGVRKAVVLWNGTYTGTARRHVLTNPIPYSGVGRVLRFKARGYNQANQPVYAHLNFLGAGTAYISAVNMPWGAGEGPSTKEMQVTVPDGTAYIQFLVYNASGSNWSGYAVVSEIELCEAASASMIVDGAVTAGKIAAGAVTAREIAADAVVAGKIAADAITAREIAANAITAAELAASSVIAGKIATDAVTANTIAANAVTAVKIAAGSVETAKLAAGAVTAGTIAAGAVVASKLSLSPANLCPDPWFMDAGFWAPDGGGWFYEDAGTNTTGVQLGSRRSAILWDGAYSGAGRKHIWSNLLPFSGAGKTLRLRGRAFLSTVTQSVQVEVQFYDISGVTTGALGLNWGTAGVSAKEAQIVVPAGTASLRFVVYNSAPGGGWTGVAAVSDVELCEAASASMIVDGAVTTNKLTADAVTAGKIAAGAVNAREIAASAVTASKLAVVPENLVADPYIQDDGYWTISGTGYQPLDATNGTVAAMNVPRAFHANTTSMAGQPWAYLQREIPIEAGVEYLAEASCASSGGVRPWLDLVFFSATGAQLAVLPSSTATLPAGKAKWVVAAPANASKALLRFGAGYNGADGWVVISGVRLTKRTGGELIVDGAITADKLTANAVTADKVAAAAVTASKLAITDPTNLLTNPDFRNGSTDGWALADGAVLEDTGSAADPGGRWRVRTSGVHSLIWAPTITTFDGEYFYLSARIYNTSPVPVVRVGLMMLDDLGNTVNGTWLWVGGVNAYANWTTIEGRVQVLPGTRQVRFYTYVQNPTGYTLFGNLRLRRAASAELIVDGAIVADKIAANAITANKIAAGQVQATHVAAGAITASKLLIGNPDNIVPDPEFKDASFWLGGGGNTSFVAGDSIAQWGIGSPWRSNADLYLAGTGFRQYLTSFFPIRMGAKYRVRWQYYMSTDFVGSVSVTMHQPAVAWNTLGMASLGDHPNIPGLPYQFSNVATTKGQVLSGEATIDNPERSDSLTNRCQLRITINSSAGRFEVGGFEVIQVSGSTLIADGAITTSHMTANTISGDVIQTGTLNADRIVASSISATQLSSSAVTTDKLAAGAITSDKIAANAVTASQVAAGSIDVSRLATFATAQLLHNAAFAGGWEAWNQAISNSNGATHNLYGTHPDWAPAGGYGIYIHQPNATTGGFYDIDYRHPTPSSWGLIPVEAGKSYEFSLYTGAHRCIAQVFIAWCNAAGTILSYTDGTSNNEEASGGQSLGSFKRIYARGAAPAGAVKAFVKIRKFNTKPGNSDSYLFMALPFFGECGPNATVMQPWQPGGATVITGPSIQTGSISAEKIAAATITGDKIVGGTITGNLIGTAQVSSLQLAGNSVIVPAGFYQDWDSEVGAEDTFAIVSNVDSLGQPVAIFASCQLRITTGGDNRDSNSVCAFIDRSKDGSNWSRIASDLTVGTSIGAPFTYGVRSDLVAAWYAVWLGYISSWGLSFIDYGPGAGPTMYRLRLRKNELTNSVACYAGQRMLVAQGMRR